MRIYLRIATPLLRYGADLDSWLIWAVSELPKVCCIVLNWNGREYLPACLESLLQMDYGNLEIVVVDNASTDGSIDTLKTDYPGITLIENQENLFWAGGNNVGLQYALDQEADYTFLLNNDIIVSPELVTRLVARAEADPTIGALGPKIYYHSDPDRIWFAGAEVSMWRGMLRHRGIRELDTGQYDSTTETAYVTGCALMVRKAAVQAIGLIDTSFRFYGEDVDYSFRVQRAGYQLALEPEAVMWHKVSASLGVTSWRKIGLRLRSNLKLYRRYSPVWAWFTTIPVFLVLDGLRILALALSGRLKPGNDG
ncbi:MAG: glycosyltransferase family 2 protein [Candidatus Marinimicrobia bacterium]|nr:glycosyltransferase family 2 protein [Candidatus Neomarinimicrobiota bacterium]